MPTGSSECGWSFTQLLPLASPMATLVVFYLGLNSWRKHLRGNIENTLATKILICAFEVEEAIADFRSAAYSGSEIREAYRVIEPQMAADPELLNKRASHSGFYPTDAVLMNYRWKYVTTALGKIRAAQKEARALRWTEVANAIEALDGEVVALRVMVSEYFFAVSDLANENLYPPHEPATKKLRLENMERLQRMFRPIDTTKPAKDAISSKLRDLVAHIEAAAGQFVHGAR